MDISIVHVHTCVYTYIYIYICMYVYVQIIWLKNHALFSEVIWDLFLSQLHSVQYLQASAQPAEQLLPRHTGFIDSPYTVSYAQAT